MEKLKPDTSYHIFNHANGFENVFREPENYRFFLEKYRKYISPIAETYAYCLMPNHFHLVVRIRKQAVIEQLIRNKNNLKLTSDFSNRVANFSNLATNFSKVQNFGKVEEVEKVEDGKFQGNNNEIEKYISKQFANLFSSYTQAFNKSNRRMGSLFIKNFRRDPILIKEHFINAVIYTHRNPIHHGYRDTYEEWPYSSYFGIVNGEENGAESQKLIKIFGDIDLFVQLHVASKNSISTTMFEIP
jgi:putative transposase